MLISCLQVAKVAALLHKAADMDHVPTLKVDNDDTNLSDDESNLFQETKFLLPKPALSARDIKPPQWVNMVQVQRLNQNYLKIF